MGIKNRQKCVGCIAQSAAKYTDALDWAIAFVLQAANNIESILGVAHDSSFRGEADSRRECRQWLPTG